MSPASPDAEVQRDLGRHSAQIEELQHLLRTVNLRLEKIDADITEMKSALNVMFDGARPRKGAKIAVALGGAGAALGAFAASAFDWYMNTMKH